jgi:hypothetical protein
MVYIDTRSWYRICFSRDNLAGIDYANLMKWVNKMALHPVEVALIPYIQQFVERQQIVEQALRELRPRLFMPAKEFDQWCDLHPDQIYIPQSGYWGENQAWKHWLHGVGCRLTHVKTQEVIEWDFPDINCFDLGWFTSWLEWKFAQGNVEAILQMWCSQHNNFYSAIKAIIHQLMDHKILRCGDEPYCSRYILISTTLQG